jgi:Family of unknown function (DUF6496)
MAKKKIVVAKGVKVAHGKEEKMREKKGSSSAGKYKTVKAKDFAGASGGASRYSFPINTLARGRNALARAHFAPNPAGIKAKVYRKYPVLKKHKEEHGHKDEHKDKEKKVHKHAHKHDHKKESPKEKSKVKKVMHEFKHHELHSGSKKGPVVKNPKQAIAIALSEARKANKK